MKNDFQDINELKTPTEERPESKATQAEDKVGEIKDSVKVAAPASSKAKNNLLMIIAIVIIFVVLYAVFNSGPKTHTINDDNTTSQNASDDQGDQSVLAQSVKKLDQAAQTVASSAHNEVSAFGSGLAGMAGSALSARMNQPPQLFCAGCGDNSGAVPGEASKNKATTSGLSGGQDAYTSYANSQSEDVTTVEGTKIKHPEWTIVQAEVIHANLETAIDSDLPGMVRAIVKEPVYSYLGDNLLIPSGSRLIGQYSTSQGNGLATRRVFVVWNRIVTPDGVSVIINSPSADALGQAGQGADDVDHHFFMMFGTGFLYSVLSAYAATAGVNSQTQANSANQLQGGLAQSLGQTAQQSLQGNMSIQPTLYVNQGADINVFVSRDVDLYRVLGTQGSNHE